MNWESQSPLFGEAEKDWFRLPDDVPVSTIFVDESGAKNSGGGFFVVGFLKARESAALDREIRHLRQRHKFFEEMKFSGIKRESLRFFYDMVELVADSDVRVGGSVYDSRRSFIGRRATWEVQASMSAKLVVANVNKGELVNVFLDLVQTPHGETVAARVRDQANQKLGQRPLTSHR